MIRKVILFYCIITPILANSKHLKRIECIKFLKNGSSHHVLYAAVYSNVDVKLSSREHGFMSKRSTKTNPVSITQFLAETRSVRQPAASAYSRIVGGSSADEGQFPFAAAIFIETVDNVIFCGGTLLTAQYILTAAQCVDNAFKFTIRLGSNTLLSEDNNSITITSDTYYLNPGWNSQTLENNIALIGLEDAIELTDFIRPIASLQNDLLPDNSSVITFGWGQTATDSLGLEGDLTFVSLVTISNLECSATYGNQIVDNMICTNEGTCYGDIGGPLILFDDDEKEVLVGVASFLSGRGCESSDPSGFIRIESFVDWINETI